MAEILKETTFKSVVHDNEICGELVKWGNENGPIFFKPTLYGS
mgnify:CR=1 FL=1